MDDDWDAEDFEVRLPVKEPEKSQWDDEDEEAEEAKDQDSKPAAPSSAPKPKPAKKKKPVAGESIESDVLDDPLAEKMRQQRLVEESDFKSTKELFGGSSKSTKSLEDFIPKTEAEFVEFAELLASKVTPFSKSFHYMTLLKALQRNITVPLNASDSKELSAAASVIANEKLKVEKEAAGGKKKASKKKQLNVRAEEDDFQSGAYEVPGDDYDFM